MARRSKPKGTRRQPELPTMSSSRRGYRFGIDFSCGRGAAGALAGARANLSEFYG